MNLIKLGRETVFLQLADKKSVKALYVNMFFPKAGTDRLVMVTQCTGDNLLGYLKSAVCTGLQLIHTVFPAVSLTVVLIPQLHYQYFTFAQYKPST